VRVKYLLGPVMVIIMINASRSRSRNRSSVSEQAHGWSSALLPDSAVHTVPSLEPNNSLPVCT